MFKIESYITPILLSYVDKYIKNFRPEDSQVSLWGGDASFHNLDLRLEVLEEELQLPFCFVSGHIHELLIHVPWTKLASEPITITINTIECILKLRGPEESTPVDPDPTKLAQFAQERARKAKARRELEAPPGYVQSLVNKIVGNIRIFCNNLILKYVEEDIVLSMNVKLLTFQSADAKWSASFTDIGQGFVTERKIINVHDLTVCLDKRNASGKIDVYQEPMLYRCSMVVHLLRCYHSATLKKASTMRADLYCKQMEFSMTEQQIPMLIRLVHLILALQRKELVSVSPDKSSFPVENSGLISVPSDDMELDSWAGWAWSFVPAVGGRDEDWDNQRDLVDSGHTMQIGMYVDDASLTFKVSESSNERYSGYYSQRKLKYHPLLSLKLQGIFSDCIIHGKCWLQANAGISEAFLVPLGCCSCSQNDVEDNNATIKYLKAGSSSQLHKSDSLFDADATENKGNRKQYNISWEHHLDITSEAVLLERTPAIAIDYIYQLIAPDDVTSEQLSEWGSDLEYSNMSERALLRLILGPTRTRVCSGLLHRMSTLQAAASAYDYQPYGKKSSIMPDKSFSDLPPATEDDYDALNEQIPMRTTQLTILAPVVELQLMDHPWFEATGPGKGGMLIRKKKKVVTANPSSTSNVSASTAPTPTASSSTASPPLAEVLLPKLTLECQCIDIRCTAPMYVNRLVNTVCQLPDPPVHMFRACYAERTIKVIGAYSRLILAANRHTYVVTPSSASYKGREIFKGKYWMRPDVVHEEVTLESECLTLTGTYPKLMCIMLILDKFLKQDTENSLNIIKTSSLIEDATRDFGMVYLEICIECIRMRNVKTFTTVTIDASLGSVKAFIFDPIDMFYPSKSYSNLSLRNSSGSSSAGSGTSPYYATREIQQVLFVSGPESINDNRRSNDGNENHADLQLFSVTVQYPKNPENQPHPPIVFFNLHEMCICIDPLLCKFLLYGPRNLPPKPEVIYLYDVPPRKISKSASDMSASVSETPRKLKTPRESIHSSSEPKTHLNLPPRIDETSSTESINTDMQEQIYNFLKDWFDVWKGLLLYGDISKCTIYFPIKTLSAVGSKGIQEAVQVQMTKPNPPDIMVFTLPSAVIRSSSLKQSLSQYIVTLPVTVPDNVWNQNKFTFPWTLSISGLACSTYQGGRKLNCLKPVTLTATVGLSTSNNKLQTTDHQDSVIAGNRTAVVTPLPDVAAVSTSSTAADWIDAAALGGDYVMGLDRKRVGTLSVCVHVDVTPVVITTSEIQVCLIASVIHGLNEVLTNLLPTLPTLKPDQIPPAPPPLLFHERIYNRCVSNNLPPSTGQQQHQQQQKTADDDAVGGGGGGSTLLGSHSSTTQTGCTDGAGGGGVGGAMAAEKEPGAVEGDVKLTAWLQWTVARFTVMLLAHESKDVHSEKSNFTYANEPKLKLVLDAEDIVSSLDFQSVFLKLKSKIGAASILHFVRDKPKNKWKPGPFLGIIMRTRTDTVVNEKRDDVNFANITITRASCNHTHNLWGTTKKPKTKQTPDNTQSQPKSITTHNAPSTAPPSRYITEIVVRMQPVDLILSPITLRSYYMVLEPLIWIPTVPPQVENDVYSKGRIASRKSTNISASKERGGYNMATRSSVSVIGPTGKIQDSCGTIEGPSVDAHWNNRTLPLAYLECGGFRITIPSQESIASPPPPKSHGKSGQFSSNLVRMPLLHDTCIFQVDEITLNPQAVNPICRIPIRPDLYQRGAQLRLLNVPGSDLEDRQYQLDITAIGFHTGKWLEFSPILDMAKSKGSKLKTMSENPALEWNSLGKNGLGNVPHLNLWSIINKFDVSIVAAPAMVYKRDIICGHSIEWNFVSDILFTLSLSQVKLASALMNECSYVFDMLFGSKSYIDRPKVIIPYPKVISWTDEFSEERELDVMELTRDSGFETSDLKSTFSVSVKTPDNLMIRKKAETDKINIRPMPQTASSFSTEALSVPFDILITAGKFSFVLYDYEHSDGSKAGVKFSKIKKADSFFKKKHVDPEKGYDASEEGSVMDEYVVEDSKKFKPLLYLSFQQPNAFLSQLQLGQKIQISVFDIRIKVSGPEYVLAKGVPMEADFPIHLLDTKPGEPNPDTGILPAFFTAKFSKGLGKALTLDLEIAKPTRVLCSMERWKYLLDIYKQILDSYKVSNVINREITATINMNAPFVAPSTSTRENYYFKFSEIKKQFCGISVLNIRLAQMLFTFKSKKGMELNFCFGKLNDTITITNRPERLTKIVHLDCVTIFVKKDDKTHSLLNPWTFSFEIAMFWEPWQSSDSNPQLQVSAESDGIMIDFSPEHIKTLKIILTEMNDFFAVIKLRDPAGPMSDVDDDLSSDLRRQEEKECESEVDEADEEEELEHEKEQHYKDDLRAGAFQFVDTSGGGLDELPLPYQVMFWTRTVSAMAWRYPQPRALIKVRVFPVPFKLSTDSSALCVRSSNTPSVHSSSSTQQHQQQQVLCSLEYWSDCHGAYQPYANFQLSETEMCSLELPKCRPQPAVACVWRVVLTNPYGYSRVLVSPRALAGCIRVDSYFNKHLVPNLTLAINVSTIQLSLYNHFNKDVDVCLPNCLQNYTLDAVIPESQCFLTLAVDNVNAYLATWNFKTAIFDITSLIKCNVLDYMFLSELPLLEPFTSKLELSYSKCLGISFVSKPVQIKVGAAIAHTLAVSAQMWEQSWKIAEDNSTTEPIDIIIMTHYVICNDTNLNLRFGQAGHEDIFLPSRCCHLYSWRSQKYKQMLRIALEELQWIWSEPFRIDKEGTDMIHISDEQLTIVVTVKSLSATQKQIIFSGQLIICNTLLEHFELKVLEAAVEKDKEKVFKSSQTYIVGGKTTPPSILIDQTKKYVLRLRFFGLESAWTGDIPLMENTKCAQPWLVKVPLQERGQFLSIWCRIVVQKFPKGIKILAMLWPLFMVRSNLPVSAKVHIETPTLNVHLESTVKGCGEIQQLYCPGTIDHSHQLTFQLDSVTPTSNPYVPLNYSLVDQNSFFRRAEKEDINDILVSIAKYEKTSWPFFKEEDEYLDYVIEDQPLTQVQVRYQNACQYSSALLVELLPWCLLINSLGCTVALIVNEKELCRINHKGILAPPKLEETFYLGVGLGGTWNLSLPLQVANSDWGQSFYMPKISGTIPLEGCIKTAVTCGLYICMVCINSSIVNEIRLLKISSTHILTSHLNFKLRVVCFAVSEGDRNLEMPANLEQHSVVVIPHLNETNSGVAITQWLIIGNVDVTSDFALYMSFSTGDKYGWSCPMRVDKNFGRTSFIVKTTNTMTVPLLLISQESKGPYFLSIHHDVYPQLRIENNSGIELFCSQMSTVKDNNVVVPECVHFHWIYNVEDCSYIFYTMPSISEKFPDIPQNVTSVEHLVLATDPEGDPQGFLWSNPINITNFNEQFVRVPYFGDVKVSVLNAVHTVRILIQSVSQAEISARDIRVRLSLHESDPFENKTNNNLNIKDTNSDTTTNISSYFSADESSGGNSTAHLNTTEQYSINLPKTDTTKGRKVKTEIVKHLQQHRDLVVQRVKTVSTGESYERDETNPASGLRLLLFIKRFTVTLTSDLDDGGAERTEVASVALDNVGVTATRGDLTELCVTLTDFQVDNQMHTRGSFDFPVVLIGQKEKTNLEMKSLNVPIMQLILEAQQYALLKIDVNIESWKDYVLQKVITDIRDVNLTLLPLSAYIEDTFCFKLRSHLLTLSPANLVLYRYQTRQPNEPRERQHNMANVPQAICWSAAVLARPLVLSTFVIEPMSVLLSVHSSVRMYLALDHSPLSFGRFGKRRVVTTSYRLGHALTMHYLSGALFGAGWVVGSLELLGSPGGLARAMGSGLRDFVTYPYHGIVQGPWAFLKGVTHGSASLMRHVTAGTLQSVTKLASSVARNLDRLTLDEEHVRRTDEQRRQRPQGLAQGLMQGLTGFGISLLGAVGGIAHHPLQSLLSQGGASPRSLAAGVGLGLVGVITKPLSGAAELVALTGEGLLQGAGWNTLPEPRSNPTLHHMFSSCNTSLKYQWKFLQTLAHSTVILFAVDATAIHCTGVGNSSTYEAVSLILTADALIVINVDEDVTQRVLSLSELTCQSSGSDPTMLNLRLQEKETGKKDDAVKDKEYKAGKDRNREEKLSEDVDPHMFAVEMDEACRERVADYVRNTVGLMQLSADQQQQHASVGEHSEMSISPNQGSPLRTVVMTEDVADRGGRPPFSTLTYYVNPQRRNHFLCLFSLAKEQLMGNKFSVL